MCTTTTVDSVTTPALRREVGVSTEVNENGRNYSG